MDVEQQQQQQQQCTATEWKFHELWGPLWGQLVESLNAHPCDVTTNWVFGQQRVSGWVGIVGRLAGWWFTGWKHAISLREACVS